MAQPRNRVNRRARSKAQAQWALALGFLWLITVHARHVQAQFTGDPFDPYRNAYRSSSVPAYNTIGPLSGGFRYAQSPGVGFTTGIGNMGPEVPFLSGLNASANAAAGINRLAGVGVDPFGLPPALPRGATGQPPVVGFDRTYRPNANVDSRYYEQVQERDRLYFEALNENDPAKRAELLKRFRQASSRANLLLSTPAAGRRASTAAPLVGSTGAGSSATETPRTTTPGTTGSDTSGSSRRPEGIEPVRNYQGLISWSRILDRMIMKDLEEDER